ncbi:MAG: CHAP domain-containing protein [Ruminococcus sp.]
MKHLASKVVAIALAEVGYHEKASNSQLQSKTANAGAGNWNKYAAAIDKDHPEFYNGKKNGYDWCDIFNDWCHITASDEETARKALYQPKKSTGAGCPFSAKFYRENNAFISRGASKPKPGDQIFFGTQGSEYHTGLVVAVDNTTVYTVEGNSAEQVSKRSYSLNSPSIAGYGRPKYDAEPAAKAETTTKAAPKTELKENGALYSAAYKDPLGKTSKALKSLKKGDKVTWITDDGWGWSKVTAGSQTGWVMNRHLKKDGLSQFKARTLGADTSATRIIDKKAAGKEKLKAGTKYNLICTIEAGPYKNKNYISVGKKRFYI